jgi:Ca2+-binding EF-hand superfamily protein
VRLPSADIASAGGGGSGRRRRQDYEEFLAGTLRLQIHEHNSMLETILAKHDYNDNGLIHIDDLRQVLNVTTDDDEECLQAFVSGLEMDADGNLEYMEFLHVFLQDE